MRKLLLPFCYSGLLLTALQYGYANCCGLSWIYHEMSMMMEICCMMEFSRSHLARSLFVIGYLHREIASGVLGVL
jgi:hypothetical protein